MKMSSTKDTQDTDQQILSSWHKGILSSKNESKRKFTTIRRERPRKLKVFRDELPHSQDLYEPDVESFVSACAPGITSFGTNNINNNQSDRDTSSPRRISSIRKRSLPSLSFLATTTIAAEKKKLKIEEEKRKEVIAEMEARKALALNPLNPSDDVGETNEEKPSNMNHLSSSEIESTKVVENTTSNVTMPPLLQQFLHLRNNGGEEKAGDN
mmetsp:Transcript_25691/g.40304  ORF Transcript_25691/g.40304 Transcript_25691/m.40304 type:complete len:212 (-) Transcript_25691:328-963(-)